MQWAQKQKGFTIVELLIVVVVIAILAAITIVAFNGIQNRAKETSVMSEVSQAVRKIESSKSGSTTESYPSNASQAGVQNVTGLTYSYDASSASYCVQITRNGITYSATNVNKKPVAEECRNTSLIGWWKMNGNGNDSSGNGRNATISSGFWSLGPRDESDSSIEFTGTPPTATVDNSANILPSQMTFSFWFNANIWNSSAATSFISKRTGSETGIFIMRLTSANALAIDCGGTGGGSTRWVTSHVPALSTWTHVVVTCTPTEVAAFINGVSIGSASRTTGSVANSAQLQFGQDGTGYGLSGRMDDIRLYNRVISAQEADQLYMEGAQ